MSVATPAAMLTITVPELGGVATATLNVTGPPVTVPLVAPAVPLNPSAVVLLVMLSLLETPVSSPVLRSGVEGAAGGVWSIVIVTVVPEPVFGPLPLVTLAVMVPV